MHDQLIVDSSESKFEWSLKALSGVIRVAYGKIKNSVESSAKHAQRPKKKKKAPYCARA